MDGSACTLAPVLCIRSFDRPSPEASWNLGTLVVATPTALAYRDARESSIIADAVILKAGVLLAIAALSDRIGQGLQLNLTNIYCLWAMIILAILALAQLVTSDTTLQADAV